jgi:MOSC domain-containing protein YiiM
MDSARIVSVNLGVPREAEWDGRRFTTAIVKTPAAGPVALRGVNLAGDDQADRTVHGGPDKAVYAYSAEDYAWWGGELSAALGPGTFGENLTTEGVDASGAVVGERWRIGDALLEVAGPRVPCYKLGWRMNDVRFVKRFGHALRPGAYLRIVEPGSVAPGDPVEVLARPAHGVTVRDVSRIFFFEPRRVPELLDVPELSASWHEWAAAKKHG